MTRRDALDLGLMAISLAALLARIVALALADLDEGLRNFPAEIPNTVPLWMDEEADLP